MRTTLILACLVAVNSFAADTFQLRGEVLSAESGKPLPCRIYILGSDGSWHFAKSESGKGSAVEYRKQRFSAPISVEMHTTLSGHPFVARVPGGTYTILVEHGKEYLPESRQVKVEKDVEIKMGLRRWINMGQDGWYSGDTHV